MASPDKAMDLLLELGDPRVRRTRSEHLEHALRTALALTDGDAAAVLAPGARRAERLVLHAGSVATAKLPPPSEGSAAARALIEQPGPLVLADLHEDPGIAGADPCPGVEAGPALFAAVRQREPLPGYLAVYRRRGRARFNTVDTRAMVMLAAGLAGALEVLRLSSGTEKLALTDDLTQVYNARFLTTALKRELKRAGRFGQELSLLLVRLVGYESLRTQHGEMRAGVTLREAAMVLAQQVRSFDLMARSGPDRFLVVLPQTDREGAEQVAERMRAAVESHPFAPPGRGAVTAAIGVASFPGEGAEIRALTGAAERALERAAGGDVKRGRGADDRAA